MRKATKLVASMGVVGVFAASAVLANTSAKLDLSQGTVFGHGKAISFDLGGKHAVSYFMSNSEACEVTVVLADTTGGETAEDSPGTRISVSVFAGQTLRIDERANKSAELTCSEDARAMNAKIFDRSPYKS